MQAVNFFALSMLGFVTVMANALACTHRDSMHCRVSLRSHAARCCAVGEDREVFARETRAGAYRVSPYFVAKTLVDMPAQIVYARCARTR